MTRRTFLALAAAALVSACSASAGGSIAPNPTTAPSTAPTSLTIMIKDFKFDPAVATIKKGGTVTWTNMDAMQHDATPEAGGFTATKLLKQNESSDPQTVSTAGSFDYKCSVHPNMKATLTVVE